MLILMVVKATALSRSSCFMYNHWRRLLVLCCCCVATSAHSEMLNVYQLTGPEDQLIGEIRLQQLVYEDTLPAVARRNGVGLDALQRANPNVDMWLPEPGSTVTLPTAFILPDAPQRDIVVNVSERRLYYYHAENGQLSVFPVGIGREGFTTPMMLTETVTKIENPSWTPTASAHAEYAARGEFLPAVVPPGPDNPLGKYAIMLAARGYLLHGTNQSMGVGQPVSRGCIRLYAPHIEALVKSVPNGTQVRIIRQPHKVAWHQGALYLESHADEQLAGGRDLTAAVAQIIKYTQKYDSYATVAIDWQRVTETARSARGIPVRISKAASSG